jgi:universal stress protein E
MRRLQSILYVTPGTTDANDAGGALEHALRLARSNEATLHAVVISPALPRHFTGYTAAYESSLMEHLEASMEKAMAALGLSRDDVRVTMGVELGDTPAVRIVRRVLRNAHDFLVKQAESVDRRAGFRALDMQLLRLCPCPVWLGRPISRPANEIRVAAAVDPQSAEPAGRDLALHLLRLARSLADTYGGELSIVSCWDFAFEDHLRHSPWVKTAEDSIKASVMAAERDHRAALDKLIQEAGITGSGHTHHPRGRPDRAIPRLVADLKVDILVMGTVGRTGLPGFVIGNTAENVLQEIQCSLLALKPNGFASPVRAYG